MCVTHPKIHTESRQVGIVFYALIQSILEYASPLFLNTCSYLEFKFVSLCKRVFLVIHGYDTEKCDECNILDIHGRRQILAMKLFDDAASSERHILHHLLPNFSQRNNRLILPHARTKRKTDGFLFTCNERL